ncbi:hypothetical protein [Nonomuraea sp. NPDC049309]|uniref:hypothetical protein n=1 Tax=Nonomuraea sp. NPDC049309 TaxID=3364350 RepID=UPI003720215D
MNKLSSCAMSISAAALITATGTAFVAPPASAAPTSQATSAVLICRYKVNASGSPRWKNATGTASDGTYAKGSIIGAYSGSQSNGRLKTTISIPGGGGATFWITAGHVSRTNDACML